VKLKFPVKKRSRPVNLRLPAEHYEHLEKLARRHRTTVSAVIRALLDMDSEMERKP